MEVTEEVSRQIIAQVDSAYNDATGGQIRFTFRKLHPVSFPDTVILSSGDIQKATGLIPVADPGFEGAILVGVIANTSAAKLICFSTTIFIPSCYPPPSHSHAYCIFIIKTHDDDDDILVSLISTMTASVAVLFAYCEPSF